MSAASAPPEISVVIPVYNEEKCVVRSMRRIQAFMSLKNWDWECLIVDDGSGDMTATLAAGVIKEDGHFRLIHNVKNRGKGAAVRQGALAAAGRHVLLSDIDLSAPIKELDKLLAAIHEGNDVAIGSRAVRAPGADVRQSAKRWLFGRIFNLAVTTLVLKGFLDTQCGFKCFTREAAQTLFKLQQFDGFSFDVEILYLAQRKKMRIKEVPVMWSQGQDSKVRLFRDSYRMFRDLLRLRRRARLDKKVDIR